MPDTRPKTRLSAEDWEQAVARIFHQYPPDIFPPESVALFQTGSFRLHSGEESSFKIECDALTAWDWAALAEIIVTRIGPFGEVEGVPSGGLQWASELEPYATEGPLLIVDDVLTTGASMEKHRAGRDAIGAVVFARHWAPGVFPGWVTPLFIMSARIDGLEGGSDG